MSNKSNTVYVKARQAELDALHIEIGLRLKLCEWAQVLDGLVGCNGIANPLRDMINKVLSSMQAVHSTIAFPPSKENEGPSCLAAFDTDDLDQLHVLMRFTFNYEGWIRLLDQLKGVSRSDALDRMYQAMSLAVGKLRKDFTVELVGANNDTETAS